MACLAQAQETLHLLGVPRLTEEEKVAEVTTHFALSQFDLMEKIGREVKIARETAENKAKFAKVIKSIEMIRPFVMKYTKFGRLPADFAEKQFLNILFSAECGAWRMCYPGDEEEHYGEDWRNEEVKTIEDWWEACPFLKCYVGEGNYSPVLYSIRDRNTDEEINEAPKRAHRFKAVFHWDQEKYGFHGER